MYIICNIILYRYTFVVDIYYTKLVRVGVAGIDVYLYFKNLHIKYR